jgi:hypothetical protein
VLRILEAGRSPDADEEEAGVLERVATCDKPAPAPKQHPDFATILCQSSNKCVQHFQSESQIRAIPLYQPRYRMAWQAQGITKPVRAKERPGSPASAGVHRPLKGFKLSCRRIEFQEVHDHQTIPAAAAIRIRRIELQEVHDHGAGLGPGDSPLGTEATVRVALDRPSATTVTSKPQPDLRSPSTFYY